MAVGNGRTTNRSRAINMKDLELLNEQIRAQILNLYTFDISYTDAENEEFRLFEAADGYYVWPLFCKPLKTSKFKFEQICRLAENFVPGTEQREFKIIGWFTYDEFMDNYYNIRGSLSLDSYINKFFNGNQRAFASAQGVQPPQVTQWLKKDMAVIGTSLYSFRREIVGRNSLV